MKYAGLFEAIRIRKSGQYSSSLSLCFLEVLRVSRCVSVCGCRGVCVGALWSLMRKLSTISSWRRKTDGGLILRASISAGCLPDACLKCFLLSTVYSVVSHARYMYLTAMRTVVQVSLSARRTRSLSSGTACVYRVPNSNRSTRSKVPRGL